MQISIPIFSIIFIYCGTLLKIVLTLIWIPVLVLVARCIWESRKYAGKFRSDPALFPTHSHELLDGNYINQIVLVTFEKIVEQLQAYRITAPNITLQRQKLQAQHVEDGSAVIIIYNEDWKTMYLQYSYETWLWVEFVILFAVPIVAWANHE